MSKIAIRSNKDLMFPPSCIGVVTLTIDLIQNKPEEEAYDLRIIDTCTKDVEEEKELINPISGEVEGTETVTVTKLLGRELVRNKRFTYAELSALDQILNLNRDDYSTHMEYINELFRQGLLMITKQECMNGEGRYFSEAQDWEIVRD